MSNITAPIVNVAFTPLTGNGFPSTNDETFQTMMQQAASGGSGTEFYLSHVQMFADFAVFLQSADPSIYAYQNRPDGSLQATATDGKTTLSIDVQLSESSGPTSVVGVATIKLQLPDPESIDKIVNLAIAVGELPVSIPAGKALIDALFKPLVQKISQFVQKSLDNWAQIELGEDLDAAGDAIAEGAADAAEEVAEDAAEIVVEDVAAEAVIDLSAVVPPLAILGALIAIPFIIRKLEKTFILHFEVNNFTDLDLQWAIEYMDQGTMTSQPGSDIIPKMGYATDPWGDTSDQPVAYQADYSSMNQSGFTGIGFAMRLSPQGAESGCDVAAVITIPWITDNVIWLGDVPDDPDWETIYKKGASSDSHLSVEHGNLKFTTQLGINAKSGSGDEYYCILSIEPL